jgi:hypothetical protein
MCLRWWHDGIWIKSVRIRVIRGICVLSFFDGSVLLRVVVAWGLRRRRDIYGNIFINMWRGIDKLTPKRYELAQPEFVVSSLLSVYLFHSRAVVAWNSYRAPGYL